MKKNPFNLVDLRNLKNFPNNEYRYANIMEFRIGDPHYIVELSRDFLGENSLHYCICNENRSLIVANNIVTIKKYLKDSNIQFVWEHVRAVHNDSTVRINSDSFITMQIEEEIGRGLEFVETCSSADLEATVTARSVGKNLKKEIQKRLSTIPKDKKIGILLSGGLDSMTIAYLLSKTGRDLVAFTLKTNDESHDVVKARKIAKTFHIPLVEVLVKEDYAHEVVFVISDGKQNYFDTKRNLVKNVLEVSGNPKKDNVLCAVSMYLIGYAIKEHGVDVVFSGEGPNEMINDYGFDPRKYGYPTSDFEHIPFREALTFGVKTSDKQLGRGGLAKHALSRMGKMFDYHNIRLESPYFNKRIAKEMTNISYGILTYDVIKQHIVENMFNDDTLKQFIRGTVKEKFQDGAGISDMFKNFSQEDFITLLEEIYGVRKNAYLR